MFSPNPKDKRRYCWIQFWTHSKKRGHTSAWEFCGIGFFLPFYAYEFCSCTVYAKRTPTQVAVMAAVAAKRKSSGGSSDGPSSAKKSKKVIFDTSFFVFVSCLSVQKIRRKVYTHTHNEHRATLHICLCVSLDFEWPTKNECRYLELYNSIRKKASTSCCCTIHIIYSRAVV